DQRSLDQCHTSFGANRMVDSSAPTSETYFYVVERQFEDGSVEFADVESDKPVLSDDEAAKIVRRRGRTKKDNVDPVVVYAPNAADDHDRKAFTHFFLSTCDEWKKGNNPTRVVNIAPASK